MTVGRNIRIGVDRRKYLRKNLYLILISHFTSYIHLL